MSFCNRVVDEYPKKRSGEKCIPLYRALSLIQCEDSLLLGRVGKGKVMSDLHEFPYYESGPTAPSPGEQLIQTQQAFHLDLSYVKTLPSVIHHFTKYKATLFVQIFKTPVMRALDGYFWATREEIFQLALSSGHRRVYQQLLADSTSEFGFEC